METWKSVPGYEGMYQITNSGRVRRIGEDRFGRCLKTILKYGDRRGYANVTLCVNNQRKTFAVHRLVWEAFIGPIPDKLQINHKNGIKDDNRLINLEVVTASENTLHTFRVLGRKPQINPQKGIKNGRAKLNDESVLEIIRLYSTGITQSSIATTFCVNQVTISRIVLRKTWLHIHQ